MSPLLGVLPLVLLGGMAAATCGKRDLYFVISILSCFDTIKSAGSILPVIILSIVFVTQNRAFSNVLPIISAVLLASNRV